MKRDNRYNNLSIKIEKLEGKVLFLLSFTLIQFILIIILLLKK